MSGGSGVRVVVVEGYFSGSHRGWAEGLAGASGHDVRLVTHHGGFWKWRMQGGALTLAHELERVLDEAGWDRPDLLVVSDMVHLPALLGLARRRLAGVPVVAYFHENQLTYPEAEDERRDETYALTNWLSMAAADVVAFNSAYHRADVVAALPRLLRRFPDHRHTGYVDAVVDRMVVLPVGVDTARFAPGRPDPDHEEEQEDPNAPPVVLWNHRWEYDKDPAAFFAALDTVAGKGIPFRLIVAGESYQTVPPEFADAQRRFADQVLWFGTAPAAGYPHLLRRADVVVSTARHEFFGVAVVEAIAAGALPVLPDRLSYPELVPQPSAPYLYRDHDGLVDRLVEALTEPARRRQEAARAQAFVDRFDWRRVAPQYDALFQRVVDELGVGSPRG